MGLSAYGGTKLGWCMVLLQYSKLKPSVFLQEDGYIWYVLGFRPVPLLSLNVSCPVGESFFEYRFSYLSPESFHHFHLFPFLPLPSLLLATTMALSHEVVSPSKPSLSHTDKIIATRKNVDISHISYRRECFGRYQTSHRLYI